ncbi:Uncharacterised protein [Lederbergia lenta]|uniref:Uncharacterized protein n=1 Tax=Lederbergia lenta TaxID=1467 RepID=A0A2X4WF10_LEDLE|nr:Uncharacterised protein [Lederbergia lenta]
MFLYPLLLGIIGRLLLVHGKKVNLEEFEYRLATGGNTQMLSINVGDNFIFSGYLSLIAIIPIFILVLILVLLRLIDAYKKETPY